MHTEETLHAPFKDIPLILVNETANKFYTHIEQLHVFKAKTTDFFFFLI